MHAPKMLASSNSVASGQYTTLPRLRFKTRSTAVDLRKALNVQAADTSSERPRPEWSRAQDNRINASLDLVRLSPSKFA